MHDVVIVDYGACNLDSVARAVEECGGQPVVTDCASDLGRASHIILPGVGSFADAMGRLEALAFPHALREQVLERQVPFLGICLGMQLMAAKGWEGGETQGLQLIEGEVCRLEGDGDGTRIPHVGWNEVHVERPDLLFHDISSGTDFYFVHSYHLRCPEALVSARTPYAGSFISAVSHGRMHGIQFHPEKSQKVGFQLLRNFLAT